MVLGPNRRRQAGGVLHEYVSLDGARRRGGGGGDARPITDVCCRRRRREIVDFRFLEFRGGYLGR